MPVRRHHKQDGLSAKNGKNTLARSGRSPTPAHRSYTSKKEIPWVILAWALNIIGLGALALVFVAWWAMQPAFAAPSEINPRYTAALPATYTPDPMTFFVSTVTPNPLATRIVATTPTPFTLPNLGHHRAQVIGYSVSGRPIEVYTFGSGRRERMIVAGIHGGYEWNTIALADELIQHINNHPEIVPGDVTLYILRNLNPDGDARAHGVDGRVNDHGVDLNRNFPANWAADWDRRGCWSYRPVSSGTGPGSEPETKALMRFLESRKVEALISYHSAALGIFPGGEPWDEKSIEFAKALARVTGYRFPPIDTGCVFTGTLADYAVEMGAVAVDMELSTHRYTDFRQNLRALEVLLNWNR